MLMHSLSFSHLSCQASSANKSDASQVKTNCQQVSHQSTLRTSEMSSSKNESVNNFRQLLSSEFMNSQQLKAKFASKCNDLDEKLNELKSQVNKLSFKDELDDAFLIRFLNVRSFHVKNTFDLIEGYLSMRKNFPHFFLTPSKVLQVFEDEVFTLVNSSSEKTLLIFQPGKWDPKKYPADVIAAGPVPFFEIICATYGEVNLVEILDFENVTWRQFTAMPVSLHKQSADLSERAMPINFNNIHIVNQGTLVDMLWAIMKPFVSEEMKKKLIFHGNDFANLRQSIDETLLPRKFGGTLSPSKFTSEQISQFDEKATKYWQRYSP